MVRRERNRGKEQEDWQENQGQPAPGKQLSHASRSDSFSGSLSSTRNSSARSSQVGCRQAATDSLRRPPSTGSVEMTSGNKEFNRRVPAQNTVGLFNNDPSVKGRLEAFDDGIRRLLTPGKTDEEADAARYNWPSVATDQRNTGKESHLCCGRVAQPRYGSDTGQKHRPVTGVSDWPA